MIWYRHWLELRAPLLVIAVLLVLQLPFNALHLAGTLRSAQAAGAAESWRWLGTYLLFHWVPLVLFAVVFGGASPGGGWQSSSASAYYTLSLPVSRRRLIVTRVAAVFGAMTVIAAAAFALHAGVARAVVGSPLPLTEIATVWAAGIPVLLAVIVATSLVQAWIRHTGLRAAVMIAALAVAIPAVRLLFVKAVRPDESAAPILAGFVVVAAAALACLLWRTPHSEY